MLPSMRLRGPVRFDATLDSPSDGPDGELTCPNPDRPVLAKITCHMHNFLVDAGLSPASIVDDAETIHTPTAEADLLNKGWAHMPDSMGLHVYELGHPTLYEDGQRALFTGDGWSSWFTFGEAAPPANAGFMEDIAIDSSGGVVHNVVQPLPP